MVTSHCGLGERCEDGGNCLASSLTVCLRVWEREWSEMMISEGERRYEGCGVEMLQACCFGCLLSVDDM